MSSPEAPRPKTIQPLNKGGEGTFSTANVPGKPLESSLTQQNKGIQQNSLRELGRNVISTPAIGKQEQSPIDITRRSGREPSPVTPAQPNAVHNEAQRDTNRIHSQEQLQDLSYKDYILQTGGRDIDHIYGEPLADADKDYITRTYSEYLIKTSPILNQKHRDDLIEKKLEGRPRGTFEMDGKTVTILEAFLVHIARGELRKEEARAKGELDKYYLSLFHKEPYTALTPEQKEERNIETVNIVTNVLREEAKDARFDQIAGAIQKDIWKATSLDNPVITIKPDYRAVVSIKKDDGTISNRSRAGITISYPRNDLRKEYTNEAEKRESLFFGIGYFTDRSQVAPEAQQSISDEALKKGVKAYFVERTYTEEKNGKAETKTDIVAIPFAYSDNMYSFCKYLYEASESLIPEKTMPQPSRRNQQQAA